MESQTNIDYVLNRGVAEVYPSKEGLAKLMSERKISLYQGFDPTGTRLHIGHMVAFRKLRQFQILGHEVIFLIGDGTGQAGDPSGKNKTREKFFDREELRKNAEDYVRQASKIVKFDGDNPVKILYNGDWLNELKLADILNIAQHFTIQQLIERDMFQRRLEENEPINLREFLYPLLQGYDSVAMEVDLEIGGTDQTFNMLAGRQLEKAILGKDKFVLTTPLLADASGKKIGKSEGNVIGLTDNPIDLYGQIMALGDDAIIPMFELLTDVPNEKINEIKQSMDNGANPLQYKKQAAFDITRQLNSEKEAAEAQNYFEETFQRRNIESVQGMIRVNGNATITQILVENNLVSSNTEAKRLIKEGAVDIDKRTILDPTYMVSPSDDEKILKVGKKNIIKLKLNE